MSVSPLVTLLLVALCAHGAAAQGFGFTSSLPNAGVFEQLGESYPKGSHLVNHDVIVGAMPWVTDRDTTRSYWQITGAANHGFAPIYLFPGDRLVLFTPASGDGNAARSYIPAMFNGEARYKACDTLMTTNIARSQSFLPGPGTPALVNRYVVSFDHVGQYFLGDLGRLRGLGAVLNCPRGLKLRVSVGTGITPAWDTQGAAPAPDLRHHMWVVGGKDGWRQQADFGVIGYAPIWAAVGSGIGFSYGRRSDVYQFTSKTWFDTCNFVLANQVASSSHGCDVAGSNTDGPMSCDSSWKDNRFVWTVPSVGNFYFASYTSELFNAFTGNVGSLFFSGAGVYNQFAYQNFACSYGRQKVEVHSFAVGNTIKVGTCNTYSSKLFINTAGGSAGLTPAEGNSIINPWLYSLFQFNEDCYDPLSYKYSTIAGLKGNGNIDPQVSRTVPYNDLNINLGGLGGL